MIRLLRQLLKRNNGRQLSGRDFAKMEETLITRFDELIKKADELLEKFDRLEAHLEEIADGCEHLEQEARALLIYEKGDGSDA